MAQPFRFMRFGVEAADFKRVPEGWGFAGPRPGWLIDDDVMGHQEGLLEVRFSPPARHGRAPA